MQWALNICIISSTFLPECNGVSVSLRNRLYHFSRMGHKVLVLCPDYGVERSIFPDYRSFQGEIFDNVLVKPVPTRRLPQRPVSPNYRSWMKWRLEDYIGSFRPDIISVEEPERIYGLKLFGMLPYKSYGKCIGVDYARKVGIPIAAFYHTNFPAFADSVVPMGVPTPYRKDPGRVYSEAYGSYDVTFCSCADAHDFLKGHGLERVREGLFLGFDDKLFVTDDKSPLVEDDGKIKIFYAGRFEKEKNITLVFDVFRKVQELRQDTVLYLAGGGEGLEEVLEAGRQSAGVRYIGFLSQEELARVYNSVDIYFSPHKTDSFGLTTIEAMSMGLPVAASDMGGAGSLVEHGVNGFACGTVEEFVEAILLLAGDRALRKRLGENGRRFAGRYSGCSCACNLLKEYEALMRDGI